MLNSYKLVIRKIKQGFTLSEVLITMLIIGIIAAVTVPAVQKAMPDKLEAMRRKTYYILENTVSQMAADDTMYPAKSDGTVGFQNIDEVKIDGKTYKNNTKFCELFATRLTKRTDSVTNCTADRKTFSSADNVDWYLPVTNFADGYAEVKFDVNGAQNEPNCEYNAETCEKPDTFKYYILSSGRIVEEKPNAATSKFCIRTTINGSGSVTQGTEYCNLPNGTYTLNAVPAAGWKSDWADNKKIVTIAGADKAVTVNFSEMSKACIKLKVTCDSGAPDTCGNYSIGTETTSVDGNTISACNLSPGTYTVSVTPKSTHTSSWTTKSVILNGLDQTLNVDLSTKKYCATLSVTCPGGLPSVCGTYALKQGTTAYALEISGNTVKNCNLPPATYTLTVTPNEIYSVNKTSFSIPISSSDWTGSAAFTSSVTPTLSISMPTTWAKYPVDLSGLSSYTLPSYTYNSSSKIFNWSKISGTTVADFFAGTITVTPNLTDSSWKIVDSGDMANFGLYEYNSTATISTTGNIPAASTYTGTKNFMILFSSNHFHQGDITVCYTSHTSVCDTLRLTRTINY